MLRSQVARSVGLAYQYTLMSSTQPSSVNTEPAVASIEDLKLPPNLANVVKTLRENASSRAYIKDRAAPYRTPVPLSQREIFVNIFAGISCVWFHR